MKKAYIFGTGGHAKVIRSFIENQYEIIEFVDTEKEKHIWEVPDQYTDADFYIGIGNNEIRSRIFQKLKALNFHLPICRGPLSHVASDAKVGQGSFVGAGSFVMTGAQVGENVIINTYSSVDHDCKVGNHSQLTANISLGGQSTIGDNCFLGIKSALMPGVSIGNNVQVMAGSIVTKDFSDNLLIGGYPSKVIKALE